VCRALKVLCVADGSPSLASLKRAASGAEWELTAGATTADDALAQLESERPHVLVTCGPFGELVREVRRRVPGMRIVWVGEDHELPEASASVRSPDEVRAAIRGLPPPGGPVRL